MRRRLMLLMTCLFLSIGLILAQNKRVSGIVVDTNGEPIAGVSVIVKGTTAGVSTDADGKYTISIPQGSKSLVISLIGSRTKEVAIGDNLKVILQNDDKTLDEVVVTAMGITKEKKALGYATQNIKGEDLTKASNSSFASALQGKVSGIDITPSSGMPGASAKITIRGSRSFTGDNTPLYIVDGMPISSTSDMDTYSSVTGADFANRAIDIDPSDIESINVLKGQAASALYGLRASNGVIVITTKSGKNLKGKPQITFNSSVTFDNLISKPQLQTEYAQGAYGAYNPMSSTSWGPKISELPNDPNYGGNKNNSYTKNSNGTYTLHQGKYYVPQRADAGLLDPWVTPQVYDNVGDFFRLGTTFNNSLNISKGSDIGNFSLSFGSSNTKGIVPSTSMNRYNAKFAGDLKLSEKWTSGASLNYVTSKLYKQSGGNTGVVATVFPAPSSYDLAGIPSYYAGNPYKQNTYRGTGGFDAAYWAIDNNKFSEDTQRFFGNAYIKYSTKIGEKQKLDIKYQLGDDSYVTNYTDLWGYGHQNKNGELTQYSYTINEMNSLLTLAYSVSLMDDLSLDALIGNEFVNKKYLYNEGYGKDFNYSGFNHMSNLSFYKAANSESYKRTVGNFANLSLAYKNMLYLSGSGRVDRVSSMPRGNRTFFYPSVSLGWIFTELNSIKNSVVTYGKLRTSYAEVGQAGDYTQSYYTTPVFGGGFSSGSPITYPIDGITSYTPYFKVYDPNLKPQNTRSYEFGVDLEFLNGLFSLNYTFSRQNVKGQIFEVPLAGSTGSGSLITNGGSIHTNGHEVTLGIKPVDTRDIKWNMQFNFSKIDNYVDELAPGVNSIFLGGFVQPQVRAGIGEKFPVIYGVSYLRNENGDIVVDADGLPQTGEEKVIGRVSPDFTLGFNTTFDIHKLKISALFDWKQGGQMYAGTPNMLDFYGMSQKTADYRNKKDFLFELPAVKETGVDANGKKTYAPNDIKISGADAQYYFMAMNAVSESFIKETSFVKLREVSLSYPVYVSSFMNVNLSLYARNLLLWTSYFKGFDPEASQGNNNMAGAFERFSLPGTKSFGIGLNVKF